MSRDQMSRRQAAAVIATGIAAGIGGVAAGGLAEDENVAPDKKAGEDTDADKGYIDAHSHIWTRDIKRFPLAAGAKLEDLAPPSFTAEELMAVARPHGVTRAVLIQHHTYHAYDNSYLIYAAKTNPGEFRVVGMVDDRQPHPEVRMRKLAGRRVSGFRITSWDRKQQWLEGEGMEAMWRTAPETGQAICCLMDAAYLDSLDKMCRRFPKTTVVIDHFARIGVSGRIAKSDVQRLCRLAAHPNTYVKISAYYALGEKKAPYLDLIPMIRSVYDAYGARRLMWASDCPYQVQNGHEYGPSIDLVKKRLDFLSGEDRDWILRGTAEKVYFGELHPG